VRFVSQEVCIHSSLPSFSLCRIVLEIYSQGQRALSMVRSVLRSSSSELSQGTEGRQERESQVKQEDVYGLEGKWNS
jgi:hypothetical protein